MKIKIIIENTNLDFDFDEAFWQKRTEEVFLCTFDLVKEAEHLAKYQNLKFNFGLTFCTDAEIHGINKEYRNIDKPTDVITFALFFDDDIKTVIENTAELGDIIISTDTAKKQASENNLTPEQEITVLITHGILHLFGFDHMTEEDYNFVVDIQKKVFNKIFN
ncbi:rRNA maturation RNase YbeY [bacterium]|nr:rRNA maturation RNase YbeY [bacterium]